MQPEDMPHKVQRMLRIRQTGYAQSHVRKHLQRPLIDRDAFARQEADGIGSPEVPIVETHVVAVPTGAFRVRLCAPHRDRPLPVVVHLHRGAFVIGNIDMPAVDAKCRQVCLDLECIVATVDYRLAPEFKYPTQLEDGYAADLAGVAPALILVAEFDILRNSGKANAERLKMAGVPTGHYYGTGHNHGSISLSQTWSAVRQWFDAIVLFLGDHLVDLPLSRAESMGADAARVSEST